MLFTIVEPFSPADGEKWRSYCEWRGMQFERFDSIDALIRPSLFRASEVDDWEHVAHGDYMQHLITDLPYAKRKQREIGRGDLFGVRYGTHDASDRHLVGFDIIDRHWSISLLTDWGNDVDFINHSLAANALVPDLATAQGILQRLRGESGDDGHAQGCRIVSVYRPDALP